jgi:hypothetical protein
MWWIVPLLTFIGLGTFVVYSTWAALKGDHFAYGPYLSPFYSPLLFGSSGVHHGWFGEWPGWYPRHWLPASAAVLILWAPGGFRFTCYYYRGAYYKAFWADPISCAVGEPRKKYLGEKTFPLILQNVHRYFMYLAVVFLFLLLWDVISSMHFHNKDYYDPIVGRGYSFGIGVGTVILAVNLFLLTMYTFGCHSLRHLIGGRKDEISKASAGCQKAYSCVTCLNKRHMLFAWCSLFTVGFCDLYIRMCSMGIWHDHVWRIF